eukprot:50485-Chlamydomonas_euryale.AAC.1
MAEVHVPPVDRLQLWMPPLTPSLPPDNRRPLNETHLAWRVASVAEVHMPPVDWLVLWVHDFAAVVIQRERGVGLVLQVHAAPVHLRRPPARALVVHRRPDVVRPAAAVPER